MGGLRRGQISGGMTIAIHLNRKFNAEYPAVHTQILSIRIPSRGTQTVHNASFRCSMSSSCVSEAPAGSI
jgi:hypothetical protein